MEREIKFRGLSIKENKWVYGEFTNFPTIGIRVNGIFNAVIPESVGQFTVFLDKTGKEIYEGDIFKVNGEIYFVEWNEHKAGFILTTGKGYDTSNMLDFNSDSIYYSEIIGNITKIENF